jgi:hypothetical protein
VQSKRNGDDLDVLLLDEQGQLNIVAYLSAGGRHFPRRYCPAAKIMFDSITHHPRPPAAYRMSAD